LRDKRTEPEDFRRSLAQVAALMIYEATRSLETRSVSVTTPLAKTTAQKLSRDVVLVPVLRAGLGMLNAILDLIPNARVGFIGLKRHEQTLKAAVYHKSLPENLSNFEVILIDPMLATGGSSVAALNLLAERKARHVRMVNLVAAPKGFGTCNGSSRRCRSSRLRWMTTSTKRVTSFPDLGTLEIGFLGRRTSCRWESE
jgi:uracil phosphoribosyltransferase